MLYLTGTAEKIVSPAALEIMPGQASVTLIRVTRFVAVRDTLPVRQQRGTLVERSRYSPKIKYLAEETCCQVSNQKHRKAKLRQAVQLSSDLAVFKFKVIMGPGAVSLGIPPGQAIVLDFTGWIGPPQYQHMADSAPRSINDDRLRTWTVSSVHEQ